MDGKTDSQRQVMKNALFAFLLIALITCVGSAQNAKPWFEWTKEDVDKVLNKSAWGHTVVNTDTSQMTVVFGQSRSAQGSANQEMNSSYHIMLFSARPIREAFSRRVMLNNPTIKPAQLQNFVIGDYSDEIVIAVTYECTDRRYLATIEEAFNSATTENLQRKVYLELKDGKHVLMNQYARATKDGTGAKFVFPRYSGKQPFVSDDNEVLRFVAILGSGVQVSWRFKVSDMTYNGKVEF